MGLPTSCRAPASNETVSPAATDAVRYERASTVQCAAFACCALRPTVTSRLWPLDRSVWRLGPKTGYPHQCSPPPHDTWPPPQTPCAALIHPPSAHTGDTIAAQLVCTATTPRTTPQGPMQAPRGMYDIAPVRPLAVPPPTAPPRHPEDDAVSLASSDADCGSSTATATTATTDMMLHTLLPGGSPASVCSAFSAYGGNNLLYDMADLSLYGSSPVYGTSPSAAMDAVMQVGGPGPSRAATCRNSSLCCTCRTVDR